MPSTPSLARQLDSPWQYAFCKNKSTTSLSSNLSFDLLDRYCRCGSFAGIQFDFAKCFDSIPYSVIWDVLSCHGCDPSFISLLHNLYQNMKRCFRSAGCLGSFCTATNGLLQGDPLSVVIRNCVLRPLLCELRALGGISIFASADDLTVVSSSWSILSTAVDLLQCFCSTPDLVLDS